MMNAIGKMAIRPTGYEEVVRENERLREENERLRRERILIGIGSGVSGLVVGLAVSTLFRRRGP